MSGWLLADPQLASPKQSSQLFFPTIVSLFEMSHTVFKRALNIRGVRRKCAAESFKENQLSKSGVVFSCMQWDEGFVLGFEGQNKGRMNENIYRAPGEMIHGESSLLCLPQFAESSNISIVFQYTAYTCNVPSL